MQETSPTPTTIKIVAEFTGIKRRFFSFMGPVAYYTLRRSKYSCAYFCDGMLAAIIFSILLRKRVRRVSFDYSSIANDVLSECERLHFKLLVLGGKKKEAQSFSAHLSAKYPKLNAICENGFPAEGFSDEYLETLALRALDFDVVILSLGSPLQERVGQHLVDRGYGGAIFTSGAFVTQTAFTGSGAYYPKWVNSLNLRFAWRLIHEPHTRSRFKLVFYFPFSYAKDYLAGRVRIVSE